MTFILALIVPFVSKVFWFGPFERSKPLGVRFDKYAKFADSAYFANLLFYAASRCWPKLAIWAALAKVTLCLGEIHCIEIVYSGSASSKTSPPVWSFPL